MKRTMSPDMEMRMLAIKREHLVKALCLVDQMLELSEELETLTTPHQIEMQNRRLAEVESELDACYDVVNHIEEILP